MSLFSNTATTGAATAAQTQGDLTNDIPLQTPPDDSISDISFSPQSEHLAVSSWDKKVRIYEISSDGNSVGKAMYEHEAPVFSVVWSKVCFFFCLLFLANGWATDFYPHRMAPSLFRRVRTNKQNSMMSLLVRQHRSLLMSNQ
jgi:WD40 repeat protein